MGLKSNVSIKDIKKQYNKLVMDFHPDKNPDCSTCEEKFRLISKAYDILSNEDSKKHYDQTNGVLDPIESKTVELNKYNYEELV